MNDVERIARDAPDVRAFASAYLEHVTRVLQSLDTGHVAAFIGELEDVRRDRRAVFLAGNGGSAATASHMANDLTLGCLKHGPDRALRAWALTDNGPLLTACANDDGYDNVFLKQLRVQFVAGDRLLVISASGNSPNLVGAAEWVRDHGGRVLGLLGFDGGKLQALCDVSVHVETTPGEYGPVEDAHLVLDHLVTTWLQLGR